MVTKMQKKILAVPTHIITGFLGVGKTSAILHLLKHKAANERWAVLVNEFGEIGVDGSLLQGLYSEEKGVYIREVPGGCMCCAAGVPMQVALNQLLNQAKPHRLLIEPTGLGHPVEVLQSLSSEHFRDVLAIQSVITLVDARKLGDSRYTEHTTFNQQIAIADIVVGNKQDLYQHNDKARLEAYVKEKGAANASILFTQQGKLDIGCLQGTRRAKAHAQHQHDHHQKTSGLDDTKIPVCGYIKAVNQGEGYASIGWRFDGSKVFNRTKIQEFLKQIPAERIKAVFITASGSVGYNVTSDCISETALGECQESRIEIIAPHINEKWETELLACID